MICAREGCEKKFTPVHRPGRPRKYCSDKCRVIYLRTVVQPEWNRRAKLRKQGR